MEQNQCDCLHWQHSRQVFPCVHGAGSSFAHDRKRVFVVGKEALAITQVTFVLLLFHHKFIAFKGDFNIGNVFSFFISCFSNNIDFIIM